jgi:hypothetical protein
LEHCKPLRYVDRFIVFNQYDAALLYEFIGHGGGISVGEELGRQGWQSMDAVRIVDLAKAFKGRTQAKY